METDSAVASTDTAAGNKNLSSPGSGESESQSGREQSSPRVELQYTEKRFQGYEGCGGITEFLLALLQGYVMTTKNQSMTLTMKGETLSNDGQLTRHDACKVTSINPYPSHAIKTVWNHIRQRKDYERPPSRRQLINPFTKIAQKCLSVCSVIEDCPLPRKFRAQKKQVH